MGRPSRSCRRPPIFHAAGIVIQPSDKGRASRRRRRRRRRSVASPAGKDIMPHARCRDRRRCRHITPLAMRLAPALDDGHLALRVAICWAAAKVGSPPAGRTCRPLKWICRKIGSAHGNKEFVGDSVRPGRSGVARTYRDQVHPQTGLNFSSASCAVVGYRLRAARVLATRYALAMRLRRPIALHRRHLRSRQAER